MQRMREYFAISFVLTKLSDTVANSKPYLREAKTAVCLLSVAEMFWD